VGPGVLWPRQLDVISTTESSAKDTAHAFDHELEADQLDILQPPLTQGAQIKDSNAVIDIEDGEQQLYREALASA
jgi:hypothetical protein